MPLVIPAINAGEFTLTETRENIYSSLGSLRVKSSPEYEQLSAASLGLNGERLDSCFEAKQFRGEVYRAVIAALDSGELPDNSSYGALDGGFVSHDRADSAADIAGEGFALAYGLLGVGVPNSISGAIQYLALASLIATTDRKDPALGSSILREETPYPARIGLAVRMERNDEATAALEAGKPERAMPALSSIEPVVFIEAEGKASVEVQDGEGVDFVVDILDDILASGHGDC